MHGQQNVKIWIYMVEDLETWRVGGDRLLSRQQRNFIFYTRCWSFPIRLSRICLYSIGSFGFVQFIS